MVRKPRESGKDSFMLTPEKKRTNFTTIEVTLVLLLLMLLCVSEEKNITQRKRPKTGNLVDMLPIRKAKKIFFNIRKGEFY